MRIALVEKKKHLGFTLIELLVVIGILGVLAAIGLRSFRSSQIKGRDAQRKHDLGQLQRALEFYYNDNEEYPETLPAGEWRSAEGTVYIKSVPQDPSGHLYPYECYPSDACLLGGGSTYKIFAHLENQKDISIVPDDCAEVLDKDCGGRPCNYGVSSANLDLCTAPEE